MQVAAAEALGLADDGETLTIDDTETAEETTEEEIMELELTGIEEAIELAEETVALLDATEVGHTLTYVL